MSEVVWKMEPSSSSAGAQLGGVDEVAVVGHGQRAVGIVDGDRLGVLEAPSRPPWSSARGRWRRSPARRASRSAVKISPHVPHLPNRPQVLAVGGDDARGFLSSVLERVQPEIGEVRASGWPKMPMTPHMGVRKVPYRHRARFVLAGSGAATAGADQEEAASGRSG